MSRWTGVRPQGVGDELSAGLQFGYQNLTLKAALKGPGPARLDCHLTEATVRERCLIVVDVRCTFDLPEAQKTPGKGGLVIEVLLAHEF